jgi:uncharacterized protein (DUF2344 family)
MELTVQWETQKMNKWINKYKCTILNSENLYDKTEKKEEIQIAKKHMKKFSSSLAIKEMQIKTTLRFHLNLVRIAIIKNTNNNMC